MPAAELNALIRVSTLESSEGPSYPGPVSARRRSSAAAIVRATCVRD